MTLKDVRKLESKKYRTETGLFFVEGRKGIRECIASDLEVVSLFVTQDFFHEVHTLLEARGITPPLHVVTEDALVRAGTFSTNDGGIALLKQRTQTPIGTLWEYGRENLVLVLDDIRDPGNLGTIIRTADWFGISHIITSETTVDVYNPKVVVSSMGSFTRVRVTQVELLPFLRTAKEEDLPSYGAVLDGIPLPHMGERARGLLVMGSESHGIHDDLLPFIRTKVTIPRYGNAESLNVGVATGIILSTFIERGR